MTSTDVARQAHTYYPPFLYRNEKREHLSNQHIIQPDAKLGQSDDPLDENSYQKFIQNDYTPDPMFREILSFVNDNKGNNFLLMWTTPLPHVPLQAPKKWTGYYVNKFGEEEPYTGNSGYYPTRYPRATYAAMVSYLDEQIGLLIEHLKENGLKRSLPLPNFNRLPSGLPLCTFFRPARHGTGHRMTMRPISITVGSRIEIRQKDMTGKTLHSHSFIYFPLFIYLL